MIVKPRIRGFISLSAHPQGCEKLVDESFKFFDSALKPKDGLKFKRVLVVGASMGYGLSSRIAAASLYNADTVGVIYERCGEGERTGSAGWYNALAFDKTAKNRGLKSVTVSGDAFSVSVKERVADEAEKLMGKIDLLIYSLAAPRKKKADGSVVSSVLGPSGKPFQSISLDLGRRTLREISVPAATAEEIADTVEVMGGGDWYEWIQYLSERNLLNKDFTTLAYTYIGPPMTYPIYREGSIGAAKEHLHKTAERLNCDFQVDARVSVNGAVVTQSSCAIPIVPLYLSVLAKIFKGNCCAEPIDSAMLRLFGEKIFSKNGELLIRMDESEMQEKLQAQIAQAFQTMTDETLPKHADTEAFFNAFYKLSGFGVESVDYQADIEIIEKGEIITI